MKTEAEILVEPGVWVDYEMTTISGGREAPVLVVLPPIGGSKELLSPFTAEIARYRRVLVCEPPGEGGSSPPHGAPSTRRLASDVLTVLERLNIRTIDLFGESLGGMVAQWIAIDAPSMVGRLILGSTAARGLKPPEVDAKEALVAQARCLAPSSERASRQMEAVIESELPSDAHGPQTKKASNPRINHNWLTLAWLTTAAAKHDATESLRNVRCPTLILSGSADELVPIEVQHELVNAIPHASHAFVENAGHDMMVDRPVETADAVRSFLGMFFERALG